MPQNNISILCTREIEAELVQEAASRKILVDVIPFTRIERVTSIEIQQEVKQASTQTATVVFTSSNALEAVVADLSGYRPNWEIFCIGRATRELVEKYFGKNSIAGIADNAKELAQKIVDNGHRDEVIFFCGDRRRDELTTVLKKNQMRVNEIVVYHTVALSQKIEKKYNGILFFSPSAVQSFFESNQLDDQTILFAIGNTTANEIKNYLRGSVGHSNNKIVVGNVPGQAELLRKMIDYFQTHSFHH